MWGLVVLVLDSTTMLIIDSAMEMGQVTKHGIAGEFWVAGLVLEVRVKFWTSSELLDPLYSCPKCILFALAGTRS
jgi:hypothetical protein